MGKVRPGDAVLRTWANAALALLVAAAALAVVGLLASRALGGPLEPPGAPVPTRPLLEPRVPIAQPSSSADFPIVISQPGSYYLASDITGVAGKVGISITASQVELDLNGFHIIGVPGSTNGIGVPDFEDGLRIHGGVITKWGGTGIDAGAASGGSFDDLQLIDNGSHGISVGSGNTLARVEARGHTGYGIQLTSIGDGGRIDDCVATDNGYGVGVFGDSVVVNGCVLTGNSVAGVDISGTQNRIEENFFRDNGVGVRAAGSFNAVARNLLIQTAATAFSNFSNDNHIGSSATIGVNTVSSGDTWSNIRFDP
jgi:hypothetical protein